MKIILVLFCLIAGITVKGQKDSIYIPKTDASGMNTPTRHMFVGTRNEIFIPSGFIKIESNSKIDSLVINKGELPNYYVIPEKEGKTYVKAVIRKNDGSVYTTESNFIAILTPPIAVEIDELKLYKSKTVDFIFVDSTLNREMSKRYQLAWFIPDIKIFNSKHEQVSLIGSFDFTQENKNEDYKKYLIKGYTILVPSIAIRDNDTDLLYWTKEYYYKIK